MNEIDELKQQIADLTARVSDLEARLDQPTTTKPKANAATPSTAIPSEMVEQIKIILAQLGEVDVAALRQALVKGGMSSSVTRSDVNKTLYNHKDLFVIARQEGAKPLWKLV